MSFLIILFYQEPSALQEVDDHDDLNRSQERTTESDVGWVLVTSTVGGGRLPAPTQRSYELRS